MPLRSFEPAYPLNRYVMDFWDYQDLFDDENVSLTILPDTAVYLCFMYADKLQTTHKNRIYTTQSGLSGFQTFRSDLGGVGNISGVSARLTPWGLNVFRGGIAKACAEARVDCRDIFPKYAIEELEEKLAGANGASSRVRYVEAFLMSALNETSEDQLVAAACHLLNTGDGSCSIRALARTLDTTERTLERRFLAQVGTTPKKYYRVVRLRNALLHRKTGSSWAEAAHTMGYYDQSHMIRDFRELYGVSPEFLQSRIEASPTIRTSGLLDMHQTA